jgi:hypothetical protein
MRWVREMVMMVRSLMTPALLLISCDGSYIRARGA